MELFLRLKCIVARGGPAPLVPSAMGAWDIGLTLVAARRDDRIAVVFLICRLCNFLAREDACLNHVCEDFFYALYHQLHKSCSLSLIVNFFVFSFEVEHRDTGTFWTYLNIA